MLVTDEGRRYRGKIRKEIQQTDIYSGVNKVAGCFPHQMLESNSIIIITFLVRASTASSTTQNDQTSTFGLAHEHPTLPPSPALQHRAFIFA